jgi:transposase
MDSMGKRLGGPSAKPETAAAIRQASQGATSEPPKTATKRQYDAAFKVRILRELDQLVASGERGAQGAFLRREGITWSHVHRWQKERDKGGLEALAPKKRGPKANAGGSAKELERLRRQNARLQQELRKAEIIIDVQKKLAALLGEEVPVPPEEEEP